MPNRRPFQYHKRDPAYLRARIRAYRFDAEFIKAISEANKKKPKRLCELLRSDEPLSADHRAALADLIEWHMQIRSTGRPPGPPFTLMGTRQQLERQISNMVRQELARMRKRAGSKRLPRGTINQIIKEKADKLGDIYDGDVPELRDVSFDNIRNAVKRGTKRR
jgi:hypothetical protein